MFDENKEPEFIQEQPKIIEFLPDDFIRIINSKKFLKALSIAGRETKKSGSETLFSVEGLPDKSDYFISDIIKGGMAGFDGGEEILKKDGITNQRYLNESKSLLHLHFHPNEEGAIVPSVNDISRFDHEYGEVMVIGQVENNNDISLLFVKSSVPLINEDLDEYDEKISPDISEQEAVLEILSKYGMKSALLKFKYQRGRYIPDNLNTDQIKKIGNVKIQF